MNLLSGAIIVIGLILFEVISSIDNAVVNADVLSTMSTRARRWFLVYGMFIAVFVVRGILPLVIVYAVNPSIGILGAFTATFRSDQSVASAIEQSKPILLMGGGVYLVLLFLHWLFIEKKEYAFFLERHIHHKLYVWFYACASMLLLTLAWITIPEHPFIALGAITGSTAFFITHGFKESAEKAERDLKSKTLSDVGKLVYLEILDATFSIDGVLGAFAFTISVPLILLGNGIGAFIVREITVRGTATVKKYRFLKNGAMYSIGALGAVMIAEGLEQHPPLWLPTATTIFVVSVFFWLSWREEQAIQKMQP